VADSHHPQADEGGRHGKDVSLPVAPGRRGPLQRVLEPAPGVLGAIRSGGAPRAGGGRHFPDAVLPAAARPVPDAGVVSADD